MTKKKTTLLVTLAVAIVSLVFIALRAVPRWLALRNVLNSPEQTAILAVTPETKIKVAPAGDLSSSPINIGYAEFTIPSDLNARMTSWGHGELVLLESAPLSLSLLAPANVETTELLQLFKKIEEMGSFTKAEWIMKRLLGAGDGAALSRANIVDMQLLATEARPLPFSTIFMMNHVEFQAHLIKLIMKALTSHEAKRIVPYESTHSVGLIYMREGGTRGIVELTTHDRKISQTISFKIDGANDPSLSSALTTFLATYRFAVESCPSRERIAEMIAESGIIPWIAPEEDPDESGQLEELEEKLQEHQMDLIQKGTKTLAIPLVQDVDDQLAKEGALPAWEDQRGDQPEN